MSVSDRQILETLEALAAAHPVLAEARPLAIGIREQLVARHPELDAQLVWHAVRKHCKRLRYLKALATGTQRYDLDGNVVGEVTEEQRALAVRCRDEQKAIREAAKQRRKEQLRLEKEAAARKAKLATQAKQAVQPPAAETPPVRSILGKPTLTLKSRRT